MSRPQQGQGEHHCLPGCWPSCHSLSHSTLSLLISTDPQLHSTLEYFYITDDSPNPHSQFVTVNIFLLQNCAVRSGKQVNKVQTQQYV